MITTTQPERIFKIKYIVGGGRRCKTPGKYHLQIVWRLQGLGEGGAIVEALGKSHGSASTALKGNRGQNLRMRLRIVRSHSSSTNWILWDIIVTRIELSYHLVLTFHICDNGTIKYKIIWWQMMTNDDILSNFPFQ